MYTRMNIEVQAILTSHIVLLSKFLVFSVLHFNELLGMKVLKIFKYQNFASNISLYNLSTLIIYHI
jgi:hypothetical protein